MLELFLIKMRQHIEQGKVKFQGRWKNRKFLAKLGWDQESMLHFLYSELDSDDYFRGPTPEKDKGFIDGDVYEFMKEVCLEEMKNDSRIYIKIKVSYYEDSEETFLVLSFHEAER